MHESQCPSSIGELTTTIPIFPLTGVLLLPRGLLPLNIFEPRYLAMTRAALNGAKPPVAAEEQRRCLRHRLRRQDRVRHRDR